MQAIGVKDRWRVCVLGEVIWIFGKLIGFLGDVDLFWGHRNHQEGI